MCFHLAASLFLLFSIVEAVNICPLRRVKWEERGPGRRRAGRRPAREGAWVLVCHAGRCFSEHERKSLSGELPWREYSYPSFITAIWWGRSARPRVPETVLRLSFHMTFPKGE